jgi:hypothetical protein
MSNNTCSFDECERGTKARGMCLMHYKRFWNAGDFQGHETMWKPIEERFMSYVTQGPDCWEWSGTMTSKGYGHFWAHGSPVMAHRFSYELLVGPIPSGLTLDHLCRNHSCVNPQHLEPVTRGENVLRGEAPPAHNARKTRCPRGHEYTPENTAYGRKPGRKTYRMCKKCAHLRYRRKRYGEPMD